MALDIYWIGLLILVPTIAFAAGHNFWLRPFRRSAYGFARRDPEEKTPSSDRRGDEARKFRRTFLQVYLLVMGSEWLQGPYMYTLLRDEKGLSESTVALLYTAAYASAAATAFVTGWLADRFGRRAACLAFCAIHCLASASVLSDDLRVLALGRVVGGVAITLLWTAFESWMVAEWNARNLDDGDEGGEDGEKKGGPRPGMGGLAAMFGLMTTANCITAISAGVLSHCVVLALGSKTDPFFFGMALDVCAAVLMLRTWNENHGTGVKHDCCAKIADDVPRSELDEVTTLQIVAQSGNARESLKDARVWVLSFVSCCFEGTIFLLMFFWPGSLQEAHARENPDEEDEASDAVPYGVTFACFMGTMVLGALLFNALARQHHHHHYRPKARAHADIDVSSPLKSEGGIRREHRQTVFLFCAALLLAAAVATVLGLRDLGPRKGFSRLPARDMEDVTSD
ncbi:hypothetical protein SLS62_011132 [Diatrype stigma]|uniref:Molybdate-anion transporter n=1 Tax=Diatrype stigma TaxID=117547 RepID=A0AAN9U874_9PEZI